MFNLTASSKGANNIIAHVNARIARLEDLEPELLQATMVVYEGTRQWYDSQGGGSWPPLAESTVQRKAAQGAADPARPLYFEGNLYESATSPSGPYSFRVQPTTHSVLIGVDWSVGGWQIPVVHHLGTSTAGAGHNTTIPARPIWPAMLSPEAIAMRASIAELFLRGI